LSLGFSSVVARHVAIVLARYFDLAAQEPVVDDLELRDLIVAEQADQVNEPVTVECVDLLARHGVRPVEVPRAHRCAFVV
jgi:hypothetical protein